MSLQEDKQEDKQEDIRQMKIYKENVTIIQEFKTPYIV